MGGRTRTTPTRIIHLRRDAVHILVSLSVHLASPGVLQQSQNKSESETKAEARTFCLPIWQNRAMDGHEFSHQKSQVVAANCERRVSASSMMRLGCSNAKPVETKMRMRVKDRERERECVSARRDKMLRCLFEMSCERGCVGAPGDG